MKGLRTRSTLFLVLGLLVLAVLICPEFVYREYSPVMPAAF
jgi:hypothetical protein